MGAAKSFSISTQGTFSRSGFHHIGQNDHRNRSSIESEGIYGPPARAHAHFVSAGTERDKTWPAMQSPATLV